MTALADRLPQAVATELTRRSLWGAVPRPVRPAPDGAPMLALSFDLDYREDTVALPPLVELLDRLSLPMTVFAIGRLVEADPTPYAEAAAAGHEIANHTWSHPDNPVLNPEREFWHLSEDEMAEEIGRCQDALEARVGARPTSFRSPHFKDAFRMMAALARFPEITCVSTALASKCPVPTPYLPATSPVAGELLSLHFAERRRGGPAGSARGADDAGGAGDGPPGGPLMVPLTPCPGMRWSPFCSYSAIRVPRDPARGAGLLDVPEWERRWGRMLARAARRKFASVYFDPIDVMRDDGTRAAFARMLGHAVETGWRVATVADVERAWRAVVPGARAASRTSP